MYYLKFIKITLQYFKNNNNNPVWEFNCSSALHFKCLESNINNQHYIEINSG